MKKIIISLSVIAAVAAVVIGATTSFFSDTETSTGNTFTAGELDLKIDNSSYYNGVFNAETSWLLTNDLTGKLFFDFLDLKPGDWGEDTISLHTENDAWACMEIDLTADEDNGSTEPELEDENPYTADNGELDEFVSFVWWADDGDNVLEEDEVDDVFFTENLISAMDGLNVTLADSQGGIFGPGPLDGDLTYYVGKAWCFGDFTLSPVPQDGAVVIGQNGFPTNGPDVRDDGILCDGSQLNNVTQTDKLMADISFTAVQSRNNPGFTCVECTEGVVYTATVDSNNQGTLKNGSPITDPTRIDPTEANGAPNWIPGTGTNFYSLGKDTSGTGADGWVILKFAGVVGNGAGNDLSVHEATNGRDTYPTESAAVEVSLDGVVYYLVGIATSEPGGSGDGVSYFDVSSTPLNIFQYVRLTDVTDFGPHAINADGFDLDAVDAIYGVCQ